MLDRSFIGYEYPSFEVDVEKWQLKFFAKATKEPNPIYFDEDAAIAAGHPTLPAPPTFLYCLAVKKIDLIAFPDIGVDPRYILHGELEFEYFHQIYAGDKITIQDRIVDIYTKKNGTLELYDEETIATNQDGACVSKMRNTYAITQEAS